MKQNWIYQIGSWLESEDLF